MQSKGSHDPPVNDQLRLDRTDDVKPLNSAANSAAGHTCIYAVLYVCMLSSHQFSTPVYTFRHMWAHKPGSCRRKVDRRIFPRGARSNELPHSYILQYPHPHERTRQPSRRTYLQATKLGLQPSKVQQRCPHVHSQSIIRLQELLVNPHQVIVARFQLFAPIPHPLCLGNSSTSFGLSKLRGAAEKLVCKLRPIVRIGIHGQRCM